MTDIAKRLRSPEVFIMTSGNVSLVAYEAADYIEKLEEALKKIAKHDLQAIAMDALRPGERVREKKDALVERKA